MSRVLRLLARGEEHDLELAARGARELLEVGRSAGLELTEEVLVNEGAAAGLRGCLACGHLELYRQKDFPRRIGLAVVVVAAVLAPFTWYVSLGVAAVVDWLLYHLARDMLVCYACRSEHRGFAPEPRHPRFDREIEERLLYGERAVMGKPMREGGTAGAPEPEH